MARDFRAAREAGGRSVPREAVPRKRGPSPLQARRAWFP